MAQLRQVEVMAEGLEFPEGPIADSDGSVLLVEIRSGLLKRVEPDGSVTTIADLGGGPNGAARGPDGAIYVCNNGGFPGYTSGPPCIQRVDMQTGAVDVLYDRGDGVDLGRPNDLVFDRVGNFWFTDLEKGTVHYATPDGRSIRLCWSEILTPNGIGLSPDERVLYTAHTRTRQVLRRRIARPGELVAAPNYDAQSIVRTGQADPDVLLVGLPGAQELDSLAVDAAGSVCVGTLVEGGITVVTADGAQVVKYTLPAKLDDPIVTNICFGGEDMRTAYITLALTGRLISCRWSTPGLRLNFQDG